MCLTSSEEASDGGSEVHLMRTSGPAAEWRYDKILSGSTIVTSEFGEKGGRSTLTRAPPTARFNWET
ncbi:hypothetical protein Scep_003075 [Stephania cephalantha]|uniref:Uncharacterized protein n=1 Tax=Stephania cephalantha TaxID=152367 RepID=A0AAP0KPU5_9MAGN